jgi:hypothetical protein
LLDFFSVLNLLSLETGFDMAFLFSKGNGLSEYLLPSVLLGMIILSTAGWFISQGERILTPNFQARTTGTKGQLAIQSLGANPSLGIRTFDVGNGKTITLSEFPNNMALLIESDGANGSTEKLLANLEEMITQLESAGVIDPNTESPLIRALATQGYKLSENQKILESFPQKCPQEQKDCFSKLLSTDKSFFDAFYSMSFASKAFINNEQARIHSNISSLSASELETMDRFFPGYLDGVQATDPTGMYQGNVRANLMVGNNLKAFISKLDTVNQKLADRPAVQNLINFLSGNIYFNSGNLSTALSVTVNQNGSEAFFKEQVKTGVSSFLNPLEQNFKTQLNEQSQESANAICHTGQGQNEQGQCVPNG